MKKVFIIFLCFFVFSMTLVLTNTNSVSAESTGGIGISDPLNISDSSKGPQLLIGRLINAVLGVVGSIALLMFIYGGFVWMTAAGASENVTKGKNILLWATIGLVVIFSSYALTKFVIDSITKQQQTTTNGPTNNQIKYFTYKYL